MRSITPQDAIQGIVFDFGSTLSITTASWPTIIADGAAAIDAGLREAGLDLPADFPALWAAMLRFSIQQAEQDGIERSADSVLAALLASQGFEDISPDLVRRAADRHFALEGDLQHAGDRRGGAPGRAQNRRLSVSILSNTIGGYMGEALDRYARLQALR